MEAKTIAQETAKVLQSYVTYRAVQLILEQLKETNPGQAIWFSHYTAEHSVQAGESYLEGLASANPELALRVMTVRADLGEAILEFLPEMVNSGIAQANGSHRRRILEHLTQGMTAVSGEPPEETAPDSSSSPPTKEDQSS